MSIDAISLQGLPQIQKTSASQNNGIDFSEVLKNALDKVNDSQINADNSTQQLISGEATDIHQVMLDTEEAKLSLELATQIRNKLVDAYQEIMRMQL